MARYLVGQANSTWKLKDVVNAAADGDIIEFVEGYSPSFGFISLDKSLTFVGKIKMRENGKRTFMNTLKGHFVVRNGVSVVFQNLWISCGDENNIISCKEKSNIQLIDTVIESTQTEGKVYPIVYAENNCHLILKKVAIHENKKKYLQFYAENSVIELMGCDFKDCSMFVRNAELSIHNSHIRAGNSNTLNAVKSMVTMESTTIDGCDNEKEYSAVWISESKLFTKGCKVIQPQYDLAVYVKDNSYFKSENDEFSSICLCNGRSILCDVIIQEILCIEENSLVIVQGDVNILGKNEKRVDLVVSDFSVVLGHKIYVNRVCNPNFRINKQAMVSLDEIEYKEGDISEIYFEVDETSNLSYQVSESKRNENSTTEETSRKQIGAREQLEQMIGLRSVKKEIDKMLRMVEFNQQRIAKGLEPQEQSFHSVFLGNPGTGKTTVARLIGEVLYESGAFKSDEFKLIEASEPDFISQNVGGTAQQTLALLEKAKGGVLFIDEAYALNKKDSNVNFGIEAINTILKYMEDHRDEIMIIFAGYTREMEQFLRTNPGLTSRVPNKFVFEDYTPEEIVEIGVKDLVRKQYRFENEEYYAQQVKRAYQNSLDHSNARWIRNFNEKLLKSFANRVVNTGEDDLETIKNNDIDEVLALGKYQSLGKDGEDALERLQKLIGIQKVKEQVNSFVSLAELNQRREKQGQINNDFTLHSLFLGNSGTGKTTVARIIGDVLYQKGIISQKKFVEVSRSDLVAGYIGQTAIKTREVLEAALGGVLFIDEAYSLRQEHENDFGIEAVNEILKFMEDHRNDMVIIFAGYTKEMSAFLQMNSGLASRVPHSFVFEDYTPDEIAQIGVLGLYNNGYQVDEDYYGEVVKKLYEQSQDHSNGRWVRNLNEKLIMVMSDRVSKSKNADLNEITKEDLDHIKAYFDESFSDVKS